MHRDKERRIIADRYIGGNETEITDMSGTRSVQITMRFLRFCRFLRLFTCVVKMARDTVETCNSFGTVTTELSVPSPFIGPPP